jgi:hypothetical protein
VSRSAGMNTPREAPAQQAREAGDRALLATLSLDDKVRLLTGADNWRTRALPAIGLRAMVVSDGPAGVRGVTMTEHGPLLGRILKQEWGFGGVALSDWHAAAARSRPPSPGSTWPCRAGRAVGRKLAAAVRGAEADEDVVDGQALRILRLARRVGALGGPEGSPDGRTATGRPLPIRPLPIRCCSGGAPRPRSPCSATRAGRCRWIPAPSAASR